MRTQHTGHSSPVGIEGPQRGRGENKVERDGRQGIQGPRQTMELYLSACSKAANVAATRTATSSLATDTQQCGDVSG